MFKKLYLFYTFLFCSIPLLVCAQFPVSISDLDFTEQEIYDNWTNEGETFFVIPVQLNEYLALEQIQFNIKYNPNIVLPVSNTILAQINQQEYLNNQDVSDYSLLANGSFNTEIFTSGSGIQMLSFSYSGTAIVSEADFQEQNGNLIYLGFVKQDPCYEGPILFQFWNGLNEGLFLNPNQTSAVSINDEYTTDNNQIFSIDGFVLLNILSIELIDNDSFFTIDITNGTSPFSYNWTNKLGETLSTDTFFLAEELGDYLVNISDSNGCISSLYFSSEEPSSIQEFFTVKLGPNPFDNYFNLNSSQEIEYTLTDINGRIVRQAKGVKNEIIYTSDLKDGVYFLKVSNSTQVKIFKLISI
jgi:hypothetical protein